MITYNENQPGHCPMFGVTQEVWSGAPCLALTAAAAIAIPLIYIMNQIQPMDPKHLDRKIHFIHVTQAHPPVKALQGPEFTESEKLKVLQSQLGVAKAIKDHPDCFVFGEGLRRDLYRTDVPITPFCNDVGKIFPHGLPETLQELNVAQKEKLFNTQAAPTMWCLGKIPSLYKAIDSEAYDYIAAEVSSGNYKSLFETEKEAIKHVKEFAYKRPVGSETCALVPFGALHNFEDACKEEGFSYELIDTTPEDRLEHKKIRRQITES